MAKKPKLVICRNCNAPIEKKVKICPACGAKNKKPFFKRWWFVLFVVILALGGVSSIKQKGNEKFKTNVPETAQKRETSSSIEQQTESVEKPDASTELADDFEAWDDGEMNTVELAYYLEVQTRVNKKLLEVME